CKSPGRGGIQIRAPPLRRDPGGSWRGFLAGKEGSSTNWWVWALLAAVVLAVGKGAGSYLSAWADAIQEFEGWHPGSRSYRNNNPGNLKGGGQAGAVGQDDEGHTIFSSYAAGRKALDHQLE